MKSYENLCKLKKLFEAYFTENLFSTHQSIFITNGDRRARFRIHVTIEEGIVWWILASNCSIFVSLNSHPWWHEFFVLSKVQMKWHTKGFDIVIPDTWLFCVSFLPCVNVKIVRKEPVVIVNLNGRNDFVFWYYVEEKNKTNKSPIHHAYMTLPYTVLSCASIRGTVQLWKAMLGRSAA